MFTAMSPRTIVKVLGNFKHSAKRAVLLKAELERLMLLAIAKDGTYTIIIEDDYSRSQVPTFLKPIDGTTAMLENHIANNVTSVGLKI